MPSTRLALTPEQGAEVWFSKIERDVNARGVLTSVTDLRRKLMRYIKQYRGSDADASLPYLSKE